VGSGSLSTWALIQIINLSLEPYNYTLLKFTDNLFANLEKNYISNKI